MSHLVLHTHDFLRLTGFTAKSVPKLQVSPTQSVKYEEKPTSEARVELLWCAWVSEHQEVLGAFPYWTSLPTAH